MVFASMRPRVFFSQDISAALSRESTRENSPDMSAANSQEFAGLVVVLVRGNTKGVAP